MFELQIFLLTRDRPHLLQRAIESILIAIPVEAELIVSDNSIGNETECMLRDAQGLKYVRRTPPLPSDEHFSLVLNESESQYIILFHDDDMLSPQYIKLMLAAMKNDNKIVAAACNAYIVYGEKVSSRKMMGFFSRPLKLSTPAQLLHYYFSFGPDEPPPFSGYIYRSKILKEIGFSKKCGKHSDVSNLAELLSKGPILWLPQCLMYYRYHGGNDGAVNSVADKLKLMRYAIVKNIFNRKSSEIRDLRIRIHGQWLKSILRSQKRSMFGWRIRIISQFILKSLIKLLLSRGIWLRILSRRSW
jgi:GT2 family glycosyltransferase